MSKCTDLAVLAMLYYQTYYDDGLLTAYEVASLANRAVIYGVLPC